MPTALGRFIVHRSCVRVAFSDGRSVLKTDQAKSSDDCWFLRRADVQFVLSGTTTPTPGSGQGSGPCLSFDFQVCVADFSGMVELGQAK
eukprot:409518-Rhodomonas_salina.1